MVSCSYSYMSFACQVTCLKGVCVIICSLMCEQFSLFVLQLRDVCIRQSCEKPCIFRVSVELSITQLLARTRSARYKQLTAGKHAIFVGHPKQLNQIDSCTGYTILKGLFRHVLCLWSQTWGCSLANIVLISCGTMRCCGLCLI